MARTYAERMSECQVWYSGERERASCRKCGRTNCYLKAGVHPSGKRGQPLKLTGANLEALKEWMDKAGWTCQKCGIGTGGAGGALDPMYDALAPSKESLKSVQKVIRDFTPSCGKQAGADYFREVSERYTRRYGREAWVREHMDRLIGEKKWMEPQEWEELLRREKILVDMLAQT